MSALFMFNILEILLFCIFFNVTVNAASVFSKVKFLNCLDYFFDSILVTFHRLYKIN